MSDRLKPLWQKLWQHEKLLKSTETPYFLLHEDDQEEHLKQVEDCARDRFEVFYVYKTNLAKRLAEMTAAHGFGAECVNLAEMKRAVKLHKKVLFNGIHKTEEELRFAVKNNVIILIDSLQEAETISKFTKARQDVGLRLAIPGAWKRFGVQSEDVEKVLSIQNLKVIGLHVHNGFEKPFSQDISNMDELRKAIMKHRSKLNDLQFVDIGGGYCIGGYRNYSRAEVLIGFLARTSEDFTMFLRPKARDFDYIDVKRFLDKLYKTYQKKIQSLGIAAKMYIEPGRLLSNPNVYFVTRVLKTKGKDIIVDGGVNNLPAIGRQKHIVINLDTHGDILHLNSGRVYGPLPNVLDRLSNYYYGDPAHEGDIMIVADVGAYSFSYAYYFVREIAKFYSLKGGKIVPADKP
jgi:diaminopimelate decarboxylase